MEKTNSRDFLQRKHLKASGYASSYKLTDVRINLGSKGGWYTLEIDYFPLISCYDENPLRDDFCEDSPCVITS